MSKTKAEAVHTRNDYLASAEASLRRIVEEVQRELEHKNSNIFDRERACALSRDMTFQLIQDRLYEVAIGHKVHRY